MFELALEAKRVDETEADLRAFAELVAGNEDLRRLIDSPAFAAEDKARAVSAVAEKAKLGDLARKFLGATAANGRARDIPGAARAYQEMAARHRGEITAEVASPTPLT
ncbi:MAG: F0F1 ATP synthase subunit delta, partial [Caulobacterales bacterium]|nr:F0F1 ATP synthase subunit delta [Caulobacterales bacterium]